MMKKDRRSISRATELKCGATMPYKPYPLTGDVDDVAVDDAGRAGDVGEGGAYRRNDKRDGKGA